MNAARQSTPVDVAPLPPAGLGRDPAGSHTTHQELTAMSPTVAFPPQHAPKTRKPRRPPQYRTFATMVRADESGADFGIYRGRVYGYGTPSACFDWSRRRAPVELTTVRVDHHDHPGNRVLTGTFSLAEIHAFYSGLAAPYATDLAPLVDWDEICGRSA